MKQAILKLKENTPLRNKISKNALVTVKKKYSIEKKYQFLDKVFLKVLEKHPEKMPSIFFNMFRSSSDAIIKFLSNKSNLLQDISIILKMPKWIFIKSLIN